MRTELPEKWFILYSSREEFDIINKKFNKGWSYHKTTNINGYHNGDFTNNWVDRTESSNLKKKGFKQITFKEFENLVIKKIKEENIPIKETKLPEYWFIKNDYQQVRDYLVELTDQKDIKDWEYPYIGMDGCKSYKGVHGTGTKNSFYNDARELTIEEFNQMIGNNTSDPHYEIY